MKKVYRIQNSVIYLCQQNEIIMTNLELHATIKSKLDTRTNAQLIEDAKVARKNKSDETQRMLFALIMDLLMARLPEQEFEVIYEEISAL